MNQYLTEHNFPQDLKNMDYDELELLTYELRDFLVEEISKTGGHLSSNLGIVELTIALHKIFDTPNDKIIWDVGHQSYVHKILTGRGDKFPGLRQLGGISGFPKCNESEYDVFDTGHSSTSVSLGLGLAAARDLSNKYYEVISVIGDGAMTGGLAFEALNNVDNLDSKIIVILNDNGMSISPNTGGFPKYLGRLRSSRKYLSMKAKIKKNVAKVPFIGNNIVTGIHYAKDTIKYAVIDGVMFEELGFKYFGPVDGHDIKELCETLELAKEADEPVFIHIITQKGRGYSKAETNPNVFHGIGPFDVETGQLLKKSSAPSYSRIFGNKLIEMAGKNDKIVAVSAAMLEGTGLDRFKREYPKRAFDVGIAEGHAVTFSAGLAKEGFRPFVAIYSTFLQRAYDQIIEDVCLQNLPVIFCIDRAGIVGADGETHHGIFDLSYLRHIPNLKVMAPMDGKELEQMMEYALTLDGPCAIRYPRGTAPQITLQNDQEENNDWQSSPDSFCKSHQLRKGTAAEIWAVGAMVEKALKAADILSEKNIDISVVNIRSIKPLDYESLTLSADKYPLIVTLEDNLLIGGIGEEISSFLCGNHAKVINLGWPDTFIEHGTCEQLYKKYKMDADSIAERIVQELEKQA